MPEIRKFHVLTFLSETNLFMSLVALMVVASSFWMYDEPADLFLLTFVFFATALTYNLQRKLGDHNRLGKWLRFRNVLMIISAAAMVVPVFFLPVQVLAVLFLSGALALLYAFPFFRFRGKKIALRELPYAKIWVILLVWIMSAVLAPRLMAGVPAGYDATLSLILVLVQQGALIFALTICFDIRDLPADAPTQKTLPMVFGIPGAVRWAKIALSVSFIACIFNYLFGYFGAAVVLVHFMILLAARILLRKAAPEKDPLFFTVLVDGVLVLQGLGMGLVYFL